MENGAGNTSFQEKMINWGKKIIDQLLFLPTLCNTVFEKLLASQLDQFYTELLSDYISAYIRHYSCETSLMRLTEDWKHSLNNKQIVAVISVERHF